MVCLLACSLLAFQAQNARVEVFDAASKTVEKEFFAPYMLGEKWKEAQAKFRPQALAAKNDNELRLAIEGMLRSLPVSHLDLFLPATSGEWGSVAAETRYFDGKAYVVSVVPGSDAQVKGLGRGDLVENPDNLGGDLGSFADLKILRGSQRIAFHVRREQASWPPEQPSVRWRLIRQDKERSIGVVTVLRFDDNVVTLVDQAMEQLHDTKGIIFDVRGNSGGNASLVRILSYLSERPRFMSALVMRDGIQRFGHAPTAADIATLPKFAGKYTVDELLSVMSKTGGVAFYTEDMGKRRYLGKVIGLIDERSGSSAEGFAHGLRKVGAKLVGRPTAGALLGAEVFPLPQGWSIRVPIHGLWDEDGRSLNDVRVEPDVQVSWSAQDIIEGHDPDMAKALELLGP